MTRCPRCKSFVSVQPYIELLSDWVMCRSCGSSLHVPTVFDCALVAGSRGVANQNGPKGSETKKNLTQIRQLSLFGGSL